MEKDNEKSLKEMTLEELWELFPITLVPYNPSWPLWAEEEIKSLYNLLEGYHPVITHIGSTAIPGIQAKAIIDILVETLKADEWEDIAQRMESLGYILMSRSEERMSLNKGYTPQGYAERVFHIHFHISGDNNEVLFRDYLLQHPSVAKEYEKLKLSLLPEYRNNRDGYTEAKSSFIKRVLNYKMHLRNNL